MNAKEFIDQYGNTLCSFRYYYKYTFTFEPPDSSFAVWAGGSGDDIYRSHVYSEMFVWQILFKLGTEHACAFLYESEDETIRLDSDDVDKAIAQYVKEHNHG